MKRLRARILVLGLALCAAAGFAHAAAPGKEQAAAVIKAMEAAARAHDAHGVVKYMAPNCVLLTNWPKPGGDTRQERETVDEYLNHSLDYAKRASDMDYSSTAPAVTIEGDTAVARYQVTDKATLDGKRYEATADEVSTLELVDGKVLVTKAESTVTQFTIDGKRAF